MTPASKDEWAQRAQAAQPQIAYNDQYPSPWYPNLNPAPSIYTTSGTTMLNAPSGGMTFTGNALVASQFARGLQ